MNKRFLSVSIRDEHIVVFYKKKQIFKVSNNIENATNLLKMIG